MSTVKVKVYPSKILFDLIDVNTDDIHIDDIIYSLNTKPRYNGHTPWPWTVLDHSIKTYEYAVLTSRNVSNKTKLAALLHDASEAYLGDITSPIKNYFKDIVVLDEKLQQCIYERFGCQRHDKRLVHSCDKLAYKNEQAVFNYKYPPPNYKYNDSATFFRKIFYKLTDTIKKGKK